MVEKDGQQLYSHEAHFLVEDMRTGGTATSRALSVKLVALCFKDPLTSAHSKLVTLGDHRIRCLGSKELGWDLGLGSGSETGDMTWQGSCMHSEVETYICTCYQIVYVVTAFKAVKD